MSIETENDLVGLSRAGKIVAFTLQAMVQRLRPGMTTAELDAVGADVLRQHGARSAPQLVYGFPGVTCISVNDEVVHGIPGERVIHAGDLVTLDVTAELDGYMADAALTVAVPPASALKRRLCACADAALGRAIAVARAGRPIADIGRVVEAEVRRQGFAIIPELGGHGIGKTIHEPPFVPNYNDRRLTQRLTDGLVMTIEPIVSAGSSRVVDAGDGWTVRTADGSLTAHFEHTIVVTRERALVLTAA